MDKEIMAVKQNGDIIQAFREKYIPAGITSNGLMTVLFNM
jgi:hypothetical protein